MGMRELLILLLGFAIVAVILRGLYVAMQARRGQIKLAIDKNIPQDVDLDALEMAELPGGGARVINRTSGEEIAEKSVLETAQERAAEMDLGDDDSAIPVLMDSVAVADEMEDQLYSESEQQYEDPDDVLLDYDDQGEQEEQEEQSETAVSGLDAVRPDYPDDTADSYTEEQGELVFAESAEPTISEETYDSEDAFEDGHDDTSAGSYEEDPGEADVYYSEDSYAEDSNGIDEGDYVEGENFDSDGDEVDYVEESADGYDTSSLAADTESEDEARVEPSFDPNAVLDDDSENFSMTAGERIGYQEEPGNSGRGLFSRFTSSVTSSEELDEDSAEDNVPVKRNSLFSAIRQKVVDSSIERFRSEPAEAEEFEDDAIDEPLEEETEDYIDDEPVQYDIEQQAIQEEAESPTATELRPVASSGQPTEVRQQNSAMQPSEVVVLNVMAKEGYAFHGEDLMQTLITNGLKFGEMAIFHQRLGNDSRGPVVFSVANVLNPGTFNLNDMANFSTVGISMFLALPSPINNLEAFDMMLGTAQRLCDVLDGDLKDDHRNVMTAQTIEHYRQRIRDFELRQLKAAGSRG